MLSPVHMFHADPGCVQAAAVRMQARVWRPRSGAQLAADVVEKVLATGSYL